MAKETSETNLCDGRLELSGPLTIDRAGQVRELLLQSLTAPGQLVCDLREVDEVDVAGWQLLWAARRFAELQGQTLLLAGDHAVWHALARQAGFERGPAGTLFGGRD